MVSFGSVIYENGVYEHKNEGGFRVTCEFVDVINYLYHGIYIA